MFKKGFTGQNGRKFAKSTGIGLYLCKILCQKMYLDIRVESSIDVGTTIEIMREPMEMIGHVLFMQILFYITSYFSRYPFGCRI